MKVIFVKSSNNINNFPPDDIPEFAFIGRSNVGKSSLINMLADEKQLAKTSSKPGKTILINHFLTHPEAKLIAPAEGKQSKKNKPTQTFSKTKDSWYLVDLPGYGYAKASKDSRTHFNELIRGYISTRKNLMCLLVLIDSRLEPQKIDVEFLSFLGENQIPFVLVFTKADKLSQNQVNKNIESFKRLMLQDWESVPEIFISSVKDKSGKLEILNFIEHTIKKGF